MDLVIDKKEKNNINNNFKSILYLTCYYYYIFYGTMNESIIVSFTVGNYTTHNVD